MRVIALTGGMGSGKSTLRGLLTQAGIPTLDADAIARQLVAKNQPGLIEIKRVFGQTMLLENGELNRAKLKQHIFANPTAKRQLEAILHPMIRQQIQQQLKQLEQVGTAGVIVEIPLLAETGIPDYIDQVIVLDLPQSVQVERVMARDHCSAETVKTILNQQASRAERLAIADFVIDTNQPLTAIQQQLDQILSNVFQK